ncbi:MAG: ligase-associated DNA damage response endonuclease PdeM [Planctomycetes bacterium]|nr:ligase-associated DNA damage response endonuclease PdeM [Planctomycetota bacterium]
MKGYRLHIAETTLLLHPSGAAFWKEESTLFVADLHLGKSTTFRRGGIPIPAGSTTCTMDRLIDCIETLNASRLVVLGDLVHARCSWDKELQEGLARLSERLPKGNFLLVEGNHDLGSRSRWEDFSIERQVAPHPLGPWILLHDELTERPQASNDHRVYLAGHVHPAIKLRRFGETIRLRCFSLYNNCLTLAAFGSFTGAKTLDLSLGQQYFAIVDDEVISLT